MTLREASRLHPYDRMAATAINQLEQMRDRIHVRQAAIMQTLDDVSRAAAYVISGELAHAAELHEAIWAFYVRFEDHLALEEAEVLPLLRQIDAWGPERVEHMLDEHRQQREVLDALVDEAECGSKDDVELADDALWLVRSITKDMIEEEEELDTAGVDPTPICS